MKTFYGEKMSYDLYCYKSKAESPSVEEASQVIETLEDSEERMDNTSPKMKNEVVTALIEANPRFEKFALEYDKIAEFENITVEEARSKYTYVELNLPEGDSAIQISVENDYVSITIPYWYENDKSTAVFEELHGYLKIIRQVAGYVVYDPQTEKVFDPQDKSTIDNSAYNGVVQKIPEMVERSVKKKPWWKLW